MSSIHASQYESEGGSESKREESESESVPPEAAASDHDSVRSQDEIRNSGGLNLPPTAEAQPTNVEIPRESKKAEIFGAMARRLCCASPSSVSE